MPTTTATKTSSTLIATETLTGTANIRRGRLDVRTSLGGRINATVANGATAPTTPPILRIYVAHTSGALPAEGAADWILEYEAQHSTATNSVMTIPYPFGPDVQHVMVEIVAGNQATTMRALATVFNSASTV